MSSMWDPGHGERSHRLLRVLLVTRLVLGYYSPDLLPGRRARILARLYCLLASAVIPTWVIVASPFIVNTFLFIIFDLVIVAIVSLFQKSLFSNYFFRVQKRCRTRECKELLLKVVLYQFYIVILCIFLHSLFTINLCIGDAICRSFAWTFVGLKMAHISIIFGECPKLITLGLLYVDARALLREVQSRRRQNFVHLFIVTYELVHNDFQKNENGVKFLILFGILSPCLKILSSMEEHHFRFEYMNPASLHMLLIMAWVFFTGFLPLVMLELVASVVEDIVLELLHQRMIATDKCLRHALGCAVRSVRAQPLRYSLLRAVPLDARLAVALASLYITYTIAMLQIFNLRPSHIEPLSYNITS